MNMSRRLEYLAELLQWARFPMKHATNLAIGPGPFKRLRRVPLSVLCALIGLQLSVADKMPR